MVVHRDSGPLDLKGKTVVIGSDSSELDELGRMAKLGLEEQTLSSTSHSTAQGGPMRLNTSIVIAALTLTVGVIFGEKLIWIPISVLVAGIFDLFTRRWYRSNALGEWVGFSITLKFICSLVGFYATIGQLFCLGLTIWWIAT